MRALLLVLIASTAHAGDPTGSWNNSSPYSNQNYLGGRNYNYRPRPGTPLNPYIIIGPDGRRYEVEAGPNPYLPQGTDLNPYHIR